MEVLLYWDEGVGKAAASEVFNSLIRELDPQCHSVKKIDHQYLRWVPWERQAAALVIPGGRDTPYHQYLSGRGNHKIRSFVEQGGAYLGICAGAYYASSHLEFEKGGALEICAKRELGFYPGTAVGPALGSQVFDYVSERGTQAAEIAWKIGGDRVSATKSSEQMTRAPDSLHSQPSSKTHIYYNGGCLFDQPERFPNVTILGRYEGLEDRPAAIIECKVGAGKAVLCGVHPEISADSFLKFAGVEQSLGGIYSALSQSERARREIWRAMLMRLGLQIKRVD